MPQNRTHKLQLDSVTLNFRLYDGPPSIETHDPPRYHDTPEYTCGRYFAQVEVHRFGTYIRALNEKADWGPGIMRSLTTRELREVLDDIDAAVARVKAAGLPDESPNRARDEEAAAAEEEEEQT